eukprot:2225512-Rhodomonas_salina.1
MVLAGGRVTTATQREFNAKWLREPAPRSEKFVVNARSQAMVPWFSPRLTGTLWEDKNTAPEWLRRDQRKLEKLRDRIWPDKNKDVRLNSSKLTAQSFARNFQVILTVVVSRADGRMAGQRLYWSTPATALVSRRRSHAQMLQRWSAGSVVKSELVFELAVGQQRRTPARDFALEGGTESQSANEVASTRAQACT